MASDGEGGPGVAAFNAFVGWALPKLPQRDRARVIRSCADHAWAAYAEKGAVPPRWLGELMAWKQLERLRDVIPADGYEAQSELIDKLIDIAVQAEPERARDRNRLREWLQTLLKAEHFGVAPPRRPDPRRRTILDLERLFPGRRAFAGRERGEEARIRAGLDRKDRNRRLYQVRIPPDATSFTRPFFLGMFGGSISALGADRFRDKYAFSGERFEGNVASWSLDRQATRKPSGNPPVGR